MKDVAAYWEQRYRDGRSSGAGSEGEEGAYKAQFVSGFISFWGINRVIDWGCGDGQVLAQIELNCAEYVGIDVSPTAVSRLGLKYLDDPNMFFSTPSQFHPDPGDLALSMDVLFHLVSPLEYYDYMHDLFRSSEYYVIIYSTDYNEPYTGNHVRRRHFTTDIKRWFPEWQLMYKEEPLYDGAAQFFVYQKVG